METPATWRSPLDIASHEYCTTIFHYLSGAPTFWQRYAASIRALYRFKGPLPEKDESWLALAWYVANDVAWQHDAMACAMVETLPSMARLTLITYDQHRTQRSKPWSWKRLLPRIALDLTIFRFMLCKGPAGCDLLGTDDPLGGTPFASLKLSTRIVREIYCSYHKILLKRGTALHSAE